MFSSLHLSPDAETSVVEHVHVTRSNLACAPTFSTAC
ncbi:hypothetical protein Ahy_B01g053768 isoform B [Arachis hypogaea]|uniref:Uncharacterized protein n=1 Tax=Arachis hypogaea TaxID=3818 RepID=A0A445ASI4_ARAHY|nr:hypothetical protein Ahy_B01g053768 isoform B [Arachis hypogaea]